MSQTPPQPGSAAVDLEAIEQRHKPCTSPACIQVRTAHQHCACRDGHFVDVCELHQLLAYARAAAEQRGRALDLLGQYCEATETADDGILTAWPSADLYARVRALLAESEPT